MSREESSPERRRDRVKKALRERTGSEVARAFFSGLSHGARLHPRARPEAHGVEVLTDLPYGPSGASEHLLDVYRPKVRTGPLPVLLYLHGGGFRILSKDTHWVFGLGFARSGYITVVPNYRLAPKHPFPAAIQDAAAALRWTAENAARLGGDPSRLLLAGESAGGNLATSLAVCTSYRRPEPWASALFEAGIRPRGVIAACGLLQVTDPDRFTARRELPWYVSDRIRESCVAYLPEGEHDLAAVELADPLRTLEQRRKPERALPPFYAPCGTADPILEDTRRLGRALQALDVPVHVRVFPGEVHAFHAFVWRRAAKSCWRDMLEFAQRQTGR